MSLKYFCKHIIPTGVFMASAILANHASCAEKKLAEAHGADIKFPINYTANTVKQNLRYLIGPHGIARTKSGDLLVGITDIGDSGPGAAAFLLRSRDGGRTWGDPEQTILPDSPLEGRGISVQNLPDGRVLMVKLKAHYSSPFQASVHSAERYFDKPQLYISSDGNVFEYSGDLPMPSKSLCSVMDKVVELSNGDWILPAFFYSRSSGEPGPFQNGSGFFRSKDHGKTWGSFERAFVDPPPGEAALLGFNEIAITAKSDGRLAAIARTDTKDQCAWQTTSDDNGLTWSVPTKTNIPMRWPTIQTLPDGSFVLAAGRLDGNPPRSVQLHHSLDGIKWKEIETLPYSRTNGPLSPATGGHVSSIGTEKGFLVVYYASDPKIPGPFNIYLETVEYGNPQL